MAAYLVLSDIHSNLDALEAVLAAVDGQWDRLLVLGDLVGYGGEPNGVIDRIRALNPVAVIRGNHDKAACGIDDASNFNQIAQVCGDVDRRGADRRQPRVPARAPRRPR